MIQTSLHNVVFILLIMCTCSYIVLLIINQIHNPHHFSQLSLNILVIKQGSLLFGDFKWTKCKKKSKVS